MNIKTNLFMLGEEDYLETTWAKKILLGINEELYSKKESLLMIKEDNFSNIKENSVVIILGFSTSFISNSINLCFKNKLRPLVLGIDPNVIGNIPNISYVTIDRTDAMRENVSYLINNGAKHIAIIGVNPSIHTDIQHLNGYKLAIKNLGEFNENDIFYSTYGVEEAVDNFIKVYKDYDAAVCTNDYTAILLLSKFSDLNVNVPTDIEITGFGNIQMCKYTKPSLSTIDMPLERLGNQSIKLYRMLDENPTVKSVSVKLDVMPKYRASTTKSNTKHNPTIVSKELLEPLVDPDYERGVKPIWYLSNAYEAMDEIDKNILLGIVNDEYYSDIADKNYISDSALHYRLNKIFKLTKTTNKQELKDAVNLYFKNYKNKNNL